MPFKAVPIKTRTVRSQIDRAIFAKFMNKRADLIDQYLLEKIFAFFVKVWNKALASLQQKLEPAFAIMANIKAAIFSAVVTCFLTCECICKSEVAESIAKINERLFLVCRQSQKPSVINLHQCL